MESHGTFFLMWISHIWCNLCLTTINLFTFLVSFSSFLLSIHLVIVYIRLCLPLVWGGPKQCLKSFISGTSSFKNWGMSNFLRRAETFSSHDIFDQMTCSGKVFLIFHDSTLGAYESVLLKIFLTVPGIHPFNRKYFPQFTASTLNRKWSTSHVYFVGVPCNVWAHVFLTWGNLILSSNGCWHFWIVHRWCY